MDSDPSQGHPLPGNISFAHGATDDDDCPPLQARCASDSSLDEEMWLLPQALPTKSPPFDSASFNCLEIPGKTEIEQHCQQLQGMLHTLSTCSTIPPKYRSLISEMTTKRRGRENLIYQWGTPAIPAVGTAQVPDLLTQECLPPPTAAHRETPVVPIIAQDPLALVKQICQQQKFKGSMKNKNRLEWEEHSRFLFYAVKRGLWDKQLHMSWDTAKQEVLDPSMQNFYPWATFRGFKTYDTAMSFLGWDTHPPLSLLQSPENDTDYAINYSTANTIETTATTS
eukprot:15357272-Ditylum_brightwellii.AAC.1